MAQEGIILRWQWPPAEEERDIRSFNIYLDQKDFPDTPLHIYKFQHISPGTTNSDTTFQRLNVATGIWEIAGEINWNSPVIARVQFGATTMHIGDLRVRKKATSKSRRFKVGGSEYKWKIAENETDLFCVDSRGKVVATWEQELNVMKVERRVEEILDRIVVTCLLHIWFRRQNRW